MANSTESDIEVQYLGALASALIALILGLVIHSFIIGVNVNDWWKGKSTTFIDHIVTFLGVSRMFAQSTGTLYLFVEAHSLRNLYSYLTLAIMDMIHAFFMFANIWLTTLLSIVFCLKISNLQTRLFLYLRKIILQKTVYAFVATALFSALNSLISLSFTMVTKARTCNTTLDNISKECPNTIFLYNFFTAVIFPILFYYFSSVLLFSSLYHHTTRMKRSSNLTINLETYYSVMRFVSFTFIYNTMYFIGYFVIGFYVYYYPVNPHGLYIFFELLPASHSSYLIYRTAKLRRHLLKVLQNAIDFLFQKKDTATRENIGVAAQ